MSDYYISVYFFLNMLNMQCRFYCYIPYRFFDFIKAIILDFGMLIMQ